jgi:exodeoxyribonuclease-3
MRVTTLNLNGLRSARAKGLLPWLATRAPDLLCLQEVRSEPEPELFAELGYHSAWAPAKRPGYSGVALLARWPLEDVQIGIGDPLIDEEGRWIAARIGRLRLVSLYLPSGSSGAERQAAKERAMQLLTPHLLAPGPRILAGDYNIAHREVDLKNWRSNRQNSGFLPQERAWLDQLTSYSLSDVHQRLLGEGSCYTWWSQRGQAYQKDVGWRIDLQLASPDVAEGARAWLVDRAIRLSDHAALSIDYDLPAGLLPQLPSGEEAGD